MMNEQPLMIIVSGGNGSGKTTFAQKYLHAFGLPYIGADKIAYELSPDDPYSQSIEAGRLFIEQVNQMIESETSFIVETTLSGVTFRKQIQQAKSKNFWVHIVHVYLDCSETGVSRVGIRMQKGGHYVPKADIIRRFKRSIRNFWNIYRVLSDEWILIYNGELHPEEIAKGDALEHSVYNKSLFKKFLEMVDSDE
jgi:predicted ABC-type ATPase